MILRAGSWSSTTVNGCDRAALVPGSMSHHVSGMCGRGVNDYFVREAAVGQRLNQGLRECSGSAVVVQMRRIAAVESSLLRSCGGRMDVFVSRLGPSPLVSHVHVYRVRRWFGGVKHFPRIELSLRMVKLGVPVDVVPSGDLECELRYDITGMLRNVLTAFTTSCARICCTVGLCCWIADLFTTLSTFVCPR